MTATPGEVFTVALRVGWTQRRLPGVLAAGLFVALHVGQLPSWAVVVAAVLVSPLLDLLG
ncbi:MAG: hypothetical protein WCA82_11180 [Jiangellales bacterium]